MIKNLPNNFLMPWISVEKTSFKNCRAFAEANCSTTEPFKLRADAEVFTLDVVGSSVLGAVNVTFNQVFVGGEFVGIDGFGFSVLKCSKHHI